MSSKTGKKPSVKPALKPNAKKTSVPTKPVEIPPSPPQNEDKKEEESPPQAVPPKKESIIEIKKRSSSIYGNLLPHVGSDHWDDSLIPHSLIMQVIEEMITPPSSSDESYDSVTGSGTVIRKRRKKIKEVEVEEEEEEEEIGEKEIKRVPSLPDLRMEGWHNKSKLKTMDISEIQAALQEINEEIELIQTENLVYERTVLKMEKRELEIEAEFKLASEKEAAAQKNKIVPESQLPNAICAPDLSDDEPVPPDGDFKAYVAADDPELDHSLIAEMLKTDEGEQRMSVEEYLKDFREQAPENYDVIFHKYGQLAEPEYFEEFNGLDYKAEDIFNEENTENKPVGGVPSAADTEIGINLEQLMQEYGADNEEDPEFPGFNPRDAKKLPIGERIKYALIEEELIREEFYAFETVGIQEENAIQMYIDTYTDLIELSSKMIELFKQVIANGIHPLTGRMRAERIMRFREVMKKRILEEEAKVKFKLTENLKKKRKVDQQLRLAQNLGHSIKVIDFENLRVQNTVFQTSIEEQHADLKKLKLITSDWYKKLELHKDRLLTYLKKEKSLENDIAVRGHLKQNMEESAEKVRKNGLAVNEHNAFLKKRLLAFTAPSTLEYINMKSTQHYLTAEIEGLKKRLEGVSVNLVGARKEFNKLIALAPDKNILKQTADTWLLEIKKEVEEEGLMDKFETTKSYLDFAQSFKKRSRIKARSISISNFNSVPNFVLEADQSAFYMSGMTQSMTEIYKVGKEKQKKMRERAEKHAENF